MQHHVQLIPPIQNAVNVVQYDEGQCIQDCCTGPISVGEVDLTWPECKITYGAYYSLWIATGWFCAGHRLYLNDYILPIVVSSFSALFCILFMIWIAFYNHEFNNIYSVGIFAVTMLTATFNFSIWLYDGCMGMTYIESYKQAIVEPYIGSKEMRQTEELNRKVRDIENDSDIIVLPFKIIPDREGMRAKKRTSMKNK